MRLKTAIPLLILCALAVHAGRHFWLQSPSRGATGANPTTASPAKRAELRRSAATVETRHYSISSTATPSQTALVGNAAESLYDAYADFFSDAIEFQPDQSRLKLVLYKDQQEFKANNRSSPWAEAYYLAPNCHAYYADGGANPYHWMVHEATHQLNREVARFEKTRWIDEGLATYFATSRIDGRKLLPGSIDASTYPIWWLSSLALSGDIENDVREGRIIPLRALISGTGPNIGQHVNLYYIEFWSLSHFLFHYQDGKYADRYRELIAQGGSLENFERLLGPVDQLQVEWYGYLQQKIAEVGSSS